MVAAAVGEADAVVDTQQAIDPQVARDGFAATALEAHVVKRDRAGQRDGLVAGTVKVRPYAGRHRVGSPGRHGKVAPLVVQILYA